nr:helix-turn-helix domain-containing protein [Lachnospiraceae bacterium]
MDEIYDFGKILQSLRKKYGMTQEQLAAKINRESSIISRYEKNLQSPTFETVRAFASIFNVSMDYLSGMNNRRQISTFGLQETQIDLLLKLSDFFREKNSNLKQETDNSYALIGE